MKRILAVLRNRYFFYDILLIVSSVVAGFLLRFGPKHVFNYWDSLFLVVLLALAIKPAIFAAAGIYGRLSSATHQQIKMILFGVMGASFLLLGAVLLLQVLH